MVATDIAELLAERAARNVVQAFFKRVDDGRASAAIDFFTDAAVLSNGASRFAGRPAIADVLAAREADVARRTRHVLGNMVVEHRSTHRLDLSATILLFLLSGPEPRLPTFFDLTDELELGSDGCWRILVHTLRPEPA